MTPYEQLPETAFWASAVARRNPLEIRGLWTPKAAITPDMAIATYGSCFAQHFGRALRQRGFHWLDAEPAPDGLPPEQAHAFGFGTFSSRTGNVYTVRQLLQWIRWARGQDQMPDEIWEDDGRYYDPFRPRLEPRGFASRAEVRDCRAMTLEAFHASITRAQLLVFTLGLTEAWVDAGTGHEYPLCPGVAAGRFDPERHRFVNSGPQAVATDLQDCLELLQRFNPRLRILLTVSPVPLTATASGQHVLVATMQSKSVLRAVAGQAAADHPHVDYFPSYEIISAPSFRGMFFAPNQREVAAAGVDHVMGEFFGCLAASFPWTLPDPPPPDPMAPQDPACDEALLAAFAPGSGA